MVRLRWLNSTGTVSAKRKPQRFLVCVKNEGYEASNVAQPPSAGAELRKLYPTLSDVEAERHRLLRVVDESGEDYLYPADQFVAVRLPQAARKALLRGYVLHLRKFLKACQWVFWQQQLVQSLYGYEAIRRVAAVLFHF